MKLDPKSLLARVLIIWLVFIAVVIAAEFVLVMMVRYWYVVLMTLVVAGSVWLVVRLFRQRLDRW